MSSAKRVTKDNRKIQNITWLPRLGDCGETKTVPQKNHGQTMLKMSSLLDLKRPKAPKTLDSLNTMILRTTFSFAILCIIVFKYYALQLAFKV